MRTTSAIVCAAAAEFDLCARTAGRCLIGTLCEGGWQQYVGGQQAAYIGSIGAVVGPRVISDGLITAVRWKRQ